MLRTFFDFILVKWRLVVIHSTEQPESPVTAYHP